ncbi:spore gernimation protein [Bacillus coahuilensis m2-6]|uniref:GerAB/ArcD/ProY family transporter n=1 Tax=Bacillus coahuilensis TaxID=408580 RepID=UPI0007504D4B|nr:GerAB/ArcD/ProY family transporter [Bacillus coahuilensis]KUP09870.1 spore gernimation protein [Bacillus coahuilensis m2-6]
MKNNIQAKNHVYFNAFLVAFIVHTSQIGLGVAGVQRILYIEAKQDAWIVVLIAGVLINLTVWVMIQILKEYNHLDIYEIQKEVFGKWVGGGMNFSLSLYLLSVYCSIVIGYIEIVQAWIFAEMRTWLLGLILTLLAVKGVMGGIRVIVGVSFMVFIGTVGVLYFFYEPINYANWYYLQPVLEASPGELFRGVKASMYTMLGFEMILFVYPFVKEKNNVLKYAQIGVSFTTLIVCSLTILAIVYFSGEQLEKTIWASLSMFKIVKLPFLERFEYVAVPVLMVVIFPNLLFYLWSATRGVKTTFKVPQKYAVYALAAIAFCVIIMFKRRADINVFVDWVGNIGGVLVIIYPFVLYSIIKMKKIITNIVKGG